MEEQMVHELKTSIRRAENGYIVSATHDGNSFGDYNTVTMIYTDINEAMTFIKKLHDKIEIDFSNKDEKGSL